MNPTPVRSERAIVFLIGAVQFVNILDFVMVMPLGPDFARGLGIPISHLGLIGGSYTAAACVAGLVGSLFLDRFDRRSALCLSMVGLVAATALGGFATGLETLIAARVLAGVFGGPAASISLSIIADVIPVERRGKAMGAVMGAFSVASVFGVPAGLELSRLGGWRTPFFAVAAMGLALTLVAGRLLPPLRGHLERPALTPDPDAGYRDPALRASAVARQGPTFGEMLSRPTVLLAYLLTATAMVGMFVLVPNIASYVQQNLGFPRERLGLLYMAGGTVSFVVLRLAGRLVDRFGSLWVAGPSTLLTLFVIWAGFWAVPPVVPVFAIYVLFMTATGFRNVAFNTLLTRVPSATERARFMSIQSAVQHGAAAAGAFLSSRLLSEGDGHRLVGMRGVATVSMAFGALMPLFVAAVERRVRAERVAAAKPAPADHDPGSVAA